mgnify:CR=1 FL=1
MNTFSDRINTLSKRIHRETDGEYYLTPLPNKRVVLVYKTTPLVDFCVQGKTEKMVYDFVHTLLKFSLLQQITDIENVLNTC